MTTATKAQTQKVHVQKFPNGLTWIHRPVTHNRIAAARIFFPSGTSADPDAKAGATQLMTTLLFKGTKAKTAVVFTQAVESLGAALGAGAREDQWDVSCQSTTDRFGALFALMREALFEPAFREEEFRKERESLLNDIRADKEHIFHVAHERLLKELFPGHPYGRPGEGDEKTVASLTRADVAARHRSAINPQGAVFVTVGDLPFEKLKKAVGAFVQAWPTTAPGASRPGPVTYPKGNVLAEESHPFEQSYVMMAWPAPAFGDPDYAAVKVLNAWLGAGMSSPLFMKVREEKGLAYEVASFFPSQLQGGAFTVYAGMDPKNLDAAQERALSVVSGAVKKPLTTEELESAKRYVRGHFAMDHQTNGRQAWYLGFYEIMGKGWRYDAQYPDDIQKVTAAQVHAVAKKIFGRPPVTVRIRSSKKKS